MAKNKISSVLTFSVLALGLALASGCTAKPHVVAPTTKDVAQIQSLFEDYVDAEVAKLIKLRPKYGLDLSLNKSAFEPTFSLYDNPTYSVSPYSNVVWFPTIKTAKDFTRTCVLGNDWSVNCEVKFFSRIPDVAGSESTATCSLRSRFVNKKDVISHPKAIEDFYDPDGKPKFKINQCEPDWLFDENFNRYERPIDTGFKVLFLEKPEKVSAGVEKISKALMTIGGCALPDFKIRKVINSGYGNYHVVTTHVDEDPAARGEFYSSFTLRKEPKYDNYYISQDGYGWENYFKCPMAGDTGRDIHATGYDINQNLR